MTIKLVCYDLHKPQQNYDKLIKAIHEYGKCYEINQSVWLISTSISCLQIKDNLKKFVDNNDSLFVAELTAHASYNAGLSNVNWLNS